MRFHNRKFIATEMKTRLTSCRLLILFISAIISVVIILVIGEIWARFKFPAPCSLRDPILHHSYKPNCSFETKTDEFDIIYRYSSLGLRDKERAIPKPKDIKRILMLGDSFTEGAGVDGNKTFSAVLEKSLQNNGQPIEVINAGISGYSPFLEYLYLKNYGLTLQPDLIVVNVNVTDLIEDEKFHLMAKTSRDGEVVGIATPGRHFLPEKTRLYLWNHSRFYAHLQQRTIFPLLKTYWAIKDWWKNRSTQKLNLTAAGAPSSTTTNNPFTLSLLAESRDRYLKDLGLIDKDLMLIDNLLNQQKIPWLIVFQPHGHHISSYEWSIGRDFYHLPKYVVKDPFSSNLKTLAENNNAYFIDLTPIMKTRTDSKKSLYFSHDGHWTNRGHEIAAEEIRLFLESYGLVKTKISDFNP